jgi:hypothetical protein
MLQEEVSSEHGRGENCNIVEISLRLLRGLARTCTNSDAKLQIHGAATLLPDTMERPLTAAARRTPLQLSCSSPCISRSRVRSLAAPLSWAG